MQKDTTEEGGSVRITLKIPIYYKRHCVWNSARFKKAQAQKLSGKNASFLKYIKV